MENVKERALVGGRKEKGRMYKGKNESSMMGGSTRSLIK